MISVEKPGSPSELVHTGTKGMKWGVRKNRVVDTTVSRGFGITTTGSRERAAARTDKKPMSTRKKVAIGVGVATLAVGAAATAYYLRKNGKLSLSSATKRGGKVYQNFDSIPKVKVSELAKAKRAVDRQQYVNLMMSSKKYTPTLAEARRIANETYPPLK